MSRTCHAAAAIMRARVGGRPAMELHQFRVMDWTVVLRRHPSDHEEAAPRITAASEAGELVSLEDRAVCPSSLYEVVAEAEDGRRWRRLVTASGGATGVHPHSALILGGSVFVAVGESCVALHLEDGSVLWTRKVDIATAFGLYPTREGDGLLVHGELAISRWTLAGVQVWEQLGRDVFTGEFSVDPDGIHVIDFAGNRYCFPE